MLAYFEQSYMEAAFIENPRIDFHQYAADLITESTGITITRYAAKQIGFSILYGAGIGALAEGLHCTVSEAKTIKDSYLATFPGIKEVQKELKSRAKNNLPLTTLGGRQYYCEPSKLINGRVVDFSYKMLNYSAQASSADQTKQAVADFYESRGSAKLILIVHDELVISSPIEDKEVNSKHLDYCMCNAFEMSVQAITDCETGYNWGGMVDEVQ
jgi:DNA polymerase-1